MTIERIELLAPAAAELQDAIDWYASRSAGLEQRFLADVRSARSHMVSFPDAGHPLGDGIRRVRLRHFPYGLI